MTELQKMFCLEYIKTLNATKAYRAVYKNVTKDSSASCNASKLLSKPEIKAYIDGELSKIRSDKIADAEEVMEYLTAVMRGEIEMPPRERNKAAELICKRHGLLTENINVQETPNIVDDI